MTDNLGKNLHLTDKMHLVSKLMVYKGILVELMGIKILIINRDIIQKIILVKNRETKNGIYKKM